MNRSRLVGRPGLLRLGVALWSLAGSFAVTAQLQVPAAVQVQDTDIQRSRILRERKAIEAQFAMDEVACYRQFAVSDCLTRHRRDRRDKVSDLRRQEVLLNLADARAQASEQISRREGRVATEALVQDANRLLEEQATQQQRLERMDERIAARQQLMAQEAENTRQQMERENQTRQDDAQRESRRADEAASQRAYDERQLRAQQKTQERLKRETRPESAAKTEPVKP
jgi:hypothetical protein